MYTLITNDVEEVSIVNNSLNPETAKKVAEVGIPSLLDLYSKYNVEATFYFTATFAKRFPECVVNVSKQGHEVGCHGYSHLPEHAFDSLSPEKQYMHLYNAKRVIEKISGPIESFRAPALRINHSTFPILEKLGFKTDSSIASQRFDGPLTFGSLRKLNWLLAPRTPYFPNKSNPFSQGRLKIMEIPVSACLLAYQGTTMRILPELNKLLGSFLMKESKLTNKPVVFLFHPTEVINDKQTNIVQRRSKSLMGYIFGDLLRRRLKLRNLGSKSLDLLEELIKANLEEGTKFVSVRNYRKEVMKTEE